MKKQLLCSTALVGFAFLMASPANAACDNNSPTTGDPTIICSGADGTGVQGAGADGIQVIVNPAATINTPGNAGIELGNSADINMGGLITGLDGMIVGNGATIVTNGTTLATDNGIEIGGGSITINSGGEVNGGNYGILGGANIVSVDVRGTLTGTTGAALLGASGDTFTLHDTATVNGTVDASGGSDNFRFNAGANTSFDTDLFNTQYLNFDTFDKDGAASLNLTGTTAMNWNIHGDQLIATVDNIANANIDGGATLRFDTGGTYTGDVSGAGSLTKLGASTLVLTGNNNFTGATTVNGGGTLEVQDAAALSATSDINLNNATYRFGSAFTTDRNFVMGASNGTIDTQAFNSTLSGDISGTGSLVKNGAGDLTLSGTNSYAGLVLNAGNIIGDTDSIVGNAVLNAGSLIFNQAAVGTYSGDISGAGSFVKNGVGNLRLDGNNTYSGNTTVNAGTLTIDVTNLPSDIINNATVTFDQSGSGTYSGQMTGAGDLNKIGNGSVDLTGDNSGFSGDINITAGILSGNTANSFGSGALNITDATLGATGSFTAANDITVGGANATFDTAANDLILSGTIDGTANIVKVGTGSLELAGANTYIGDLMINQGSVIVSADTGFGNIANSINIGAGELTLGATFNVSRDITLSNANSTINTNGFDSDFSGDIDGAGRLVKTGAGVLTLTGTNTYAGGTLISAGTLVGTTASLSGNVTNNAALVVAGGGGTYVGNISGSGTTTFDGGGTFTLTGSNTYSGGTTVTSGTAVTGDTNAIFGDYTNNGDVTINGASGTYAGDMSGAGTLTLDSAGNTITLSGSNSYTGGTTVTTNTTISGNSLSIVGDYVNDGTVIFDQPALDSYDGIMSGTGSLVKEGIGQLTLGASNTYTGDTVINAGALKLNDATNISSASDIFINDAFLLLGNNMTLANAIDLGGTTGTIHTMGNDITLAGAISGSKLTIQGGGTTTLSNGSNSYTGGIDLLAGTLVGTTSSILGNIANAGSVIFDQAGSGTYAGDISGTGAATFDGGGDYTLTGTNTYSGGTTVTAGTDVSGDTSAIQGDYINDGTVTINGATGSYLGDMSGTGSLTIDTAGNVITLTGTNSYTGGTTVTAGSTMSGDTSAIQGDIANTGTVAFSQAGSGTYAGDLSGIGNVTFGGGGDYTLTGSNNYSGGTTVSALTSITGDIAAIQGDITNDGDVTFTGGDGIYAADMSGTGRLNVNMAAFNNTLTLTGTNNTYSGGTHIIQGYLIGDTDTLQGDVVNDDILAFDQNFNGTFAGDVSGTGQIIKAGTGNVTLSGSNSYAGGLWIVDGTLTGDTGSLLGDTVNDGTLVFNQTADDTFSGDISGTGDFVKNGTGNLTLSGANTYAGDTTINAGTLTGTTTSITNNAARTITNDAALVFDQAGSGTFASNIVGTGDVTFDGGGSYTLTGTNTYSGGTTLTSGTSLTGALDSIQGDITNDGDITIVQVVDGNYTGDMSGTGSLFVLAAGRTITLSGTNSYTGGTTVAGITTVSGDANSITGDYTNDGTVIFTDAGFGIYSGDMSGTGSLIMNGAGVLGITGTNTYTGDTIVNSGYLAFDTGSSIAAASDITLDDDAGLRFFDDFTLDSDVFLTGTGGTIDALNKIVTLNGDISGTRLTLNGVGGTVTLTGTNTYTSLINNLTLQGTTDSIVGTIDNEGALVFNQVLDGVIASDISGTGDVTFDGTAGYTLTGTNTYTGGTNIIAGAEIVGDTLALQGNINVGGALTFDQATTSTYAGQMTGAGLLTKDGAGNLRLTGDNSGFNGDTQINAGILSVNSDLSNSNVLVNSGGTLGGNGTVGNVIVANGGNLAPGNSIDTLNVNGDVTFNSGSTYTVEFDATPDHSDKLIATGDIIINGGSVFALGSGSSYAANTLYTIMSATNVTGTFDGGITTNLAFLDPTLIYNASNVQMKMARNDVLYQDIAENENQAQVGAAVTSLGAGNDIFEAFTGMTVEQARDGLEQLSGEHNAGAMGAIATSMAALGNTISGHITNLVHASNENMLVASLAQNPDPGTYTAAYFEPTEDDPNWDNGYVWMQMLGGMGHAQAQRISPEQDRHSYGTVAGADMPMDHGGWYGFFAGYEQGDIETDSQRASSDIRNYHIGTYITKPFKNDINVTAGVNVAYHDIDTQRYVILPGFEAAPKGETEGTSIAAHVEVSKPYKVLDAAVEPFGRFTLTRTHINGYTEKEGGAANLTVGDNTNTNAATTIGLRMGRMVYMDGLAFKVNASVGWQHVFGDIESKVTSSFASGSTSFESLGTPQERDTAVISLGVDGKLSERTNAILGYQGILGKNTVDHSIKAGVKVKF